MEFYLDLKFAVLGRGSLGLVARVRLVIVLEQGHAALVLLPGGRVFIHMR